MSKPARFDGRCIANLSQRQRFDGGGLMLLGARGTISVTANIIPRIMSQLCAAVRSGDVITMREISRRTAPLHRAMFPVKWALECLGLIEAYYRLPPTSLGVVWYDEIDAALREVLNAIEKGMPLDLRSSLANSMPHGTAFRGRTSFSPMRKPSLRAWFRYA